MRTAVLTASHAPIASGPRTATSRCAVLDRAISSPSVTALARPMLRHPSMWKLSVMFVVAAVLGAAACSREASPSASSPAETSAAAIELPAGMRRVTDVSQVCMVNDQFMGKAQIPVEVAGKTYFGCCPVCKDRLTMDPGTRTGLDPVTGKPVDKAVAVIVQDSTGKVRYFASEDTLRQWRL